MKSRQQFVSTLNSDAVLHAKGFLVYLPGFYCFERADFKMPAACLCRALSNDHRSACGNDKQALD